MSELASVVGNNADVKHFTNISDVYIKKWEHFGMSRDGGHAKLAYDWYGSWTTLYSLFGDAILCFHPSITGNTSALAALEHETVSYVHHQGEQRPLIPAARQ